jgi:hypothetical protein
VTAVWFDYEGSPYPWNGQFEATNACPTCRKQFPADVLKSFDAFKSYMYNMNLDAIDEAFGKPSREAFPKAQIGQYGFSPSSQESPTFDSNGVQVPFCPKQQTTVFNVSMPALYALRGPARGRSPNAACSDHERLDLPRMSPARDVARGQGLL